MVPIKYLGKQNSSTGAQLGHSQLLSQMPYLKDH